MTPVIEDTRQTDLEQFTGARKAATGPNIVTVPNRVLAPVLARAVGVARVRDTIPILKCVMLTARDGLLTVDANNMELATRETIAVSGGPASGCVDVAKLSAVTSRLPQEAEVTLEFGAQLTLRSKGAKVSLDMMPVADFPTFFEGDYAVTFTMDGAVLSAALGRARPFVHVGGKRDYLGGVNLCIAPHNGAKVLRIAGTDGLQMAVVRLPVPGGAVDMPPVIIPPQAMAELVKSLTNEPVTVAVSRSKVSFTTPSRLLMSKLIDAEYPDVDRVIPVPDENVWTIDKTEFLSATAIATAAFRDESTVAVRLDLSEDRTTITTVAPGKGDGTVELLAGQSSYTGSPVVGAAFNARFLENVVKLAGGAVEFRFARDNTTIVARDVDDATAVYVVMGMRG